MSRITFQKRQKEMKRQEKRRMKAEKRAERKRSRNAESAGDTQQAGEAPATEVPQHAG
jgi:hypothetical protein